MNSNSSENTNSDINPADKLQEIQTFLAEQEFRVYTDKDTTVGDNHGQVNAGYAVIPALWCMICFGFYRKT